MTENILAYFFTGIGILTNNGFEVLQGNINAIQVIFKHYNRAVTNIPRDVNTNNYAARRFSVAAPRLWNSLPLNCRTAPCVNTFNIRLKTFLFDSA